MAHAADSWIEKLWQGRDVREVGGPHSLGRTGKVEETMWDEKGALHCQMTGGWWCPAKWLEIVDCR